MGKKSRSGSGMNILEHISESLETIFWFKNTSSIFDVDPDPEFGIFFTLDPGMRKFGSGINIRVRNTDIIVYHVPS
jgi:hypothetical protein